MHIPKNPISPNMPFGGRISLHKPTEQLNTGTTRTSQDSKDTVTISPLGKAKNYIDSLMKQKQKLTESKDSLISSTLEKGGNIESVKDQIESYEEQITQIDEQIAQIMADQLKPPKTVKSVDPHSEPRTEEVVQTERMNDLAGLSLDVKQMQSVSSIRTTIDNESRILRTEIKLDDSRGGASDLKKEKLAELEKLSGDLSKQILEEMTAIGTEIGVGSDTDAVSTEPSDTNDGFTESEKDPE